MANKLFNCYLNDGVSVSHTPPKHLFSRAPSGGWFRATDSQLTIFPLCEFIRKFGGGRPLFSQLPKLGKLIVVGDDFIAAQVSLQRVGGAEKKEGKKERAK